MRFLFATIGCAACTEDSPVRRVITVDYSATDDRYVGDANARWEVSVALVTLPILTVTDETFGHCRLTSADLPTVERVRREAVPGHAMVFGPGFEAEPLVSTDWRASRMRTISCSDFGALCSSAQVRVTGYSATEGSFATDVVVPGVARVTSPARWCQPNQVPLSLAVGDDLQLSWTAIRSTGSFEFFVHGGWSDLVGVRARSLYCEFPLSAGAATIPHDLLARTLGTSDPGTFIAQTQSAGVVRTTSEGGLVTVRIVRAACTQQLAWRPR